MTEKKNERITIRVTKEEKEGIERAARENGFLNASSFILDRCCKNISRDNRAVVNKEAVSHLIKLSDMTNTLVEEMRYKGASEAVCNFVENLRMEMKYTWQFLK